MAGAARRGDTPGMAKHGPRAAPADRFPLALLGAYAAIWLGLAIAPWYRQDWLLENLLVFAAIPLLAWSHRRLRLSNVAYALLFAFFVLHAVGAHYAYSEVPYQRWIAALGRDAHAEAIASQRNHYDRFVHFAYGLLATPAAIELLDARAPQRGPWRWLLPFAFMLSQSAAYELIEAAAAMVFGGDLGQAYLGTQGDAWDAQKDMAAALYGALLCMVLVLASRKLRRVPPPDQALDPLQAPS